VIRGHAAVFNKLSDDLGGFRERVLPGAFADTLNEDVRALFNHDPNYVLGRTKSGTLQIAEDSIGLMFRVRYPDTQWARDLATTIKRGDIDQASFAFRTITDNWVPGEGDTLVRELVKVKLYDVSPVTFPAYPQTNVTAREFSEAEVRSLTAALRCEQCRGDMSPRERIAAHERHLAAAVAARRRYRERELEVQELMI
jgi:hypothetical protein